MSGTVRMENLPMTLAGMTVLAPGAEKAPSIPWMLSEGYRQRAISVDSLSEKMPVVLPRDSCRFSMV